MSKRRMGEGLVQITIGASLLAASGWLATADLGANDTADSIHRAGKQIRRTGEQLARWQREREAARIAWQREARAAAARQAQQDADHLARLRDSLTAVRNGLVSMAALLDDQPTRQLASGLGETASYLDQQVDAAEKAASRLEKTAALLQADSLRLAQLLRATSLDLDSVQQVHDALGRFAAGTEALRHVLELPRLPTIRNGLQGLETSLTRGAEQVESLASYTYPVLTWHGWHPMVDYRQFWPQGGEIAHGMYEAAAGVKAADHELATLGKELPKVRTALRSSQQVLERSRDTLATVLRYRGLIEPLVRSLPETAARLADDLPKLSQQLAATLRQTQRLRAVAQGLRSTQKQLERSVAAWPQVRQTLLDVSNGIETQRQEIDRILNEMNTPVAAASTGTSTLVLLQPPAPESEPALEPSGRSTSEIPLSHVADSIDSLASAHAIQARQTQRLLFTLACIGALAGLALCTLSAVTICRVA